jgi:mRNA-degrading endonuclease RelE of RelBE toxin-antitoxin system
MNEPAKSDVTAAIDGLEREPPEGDIIPLAGQKGIFRATAGGFRIIFRYRENDILVTHIEPRGQVYNKRNRGGKR